MPRAFRPIRVLLVVALLAAILLVVGVVVVSDAPRRRLAREREQANAEPLRWAPAPIEKYSESSKPPRAESRRAARPPLPVEGRTPFLRRLSAGTHLLALADEWRIPNADYDRITEDCRALWEHLLHADIDPRRKVRQNLYSVTSPRRDRAALFLSEGSNRRVRIWTVESAFDADCALRTGEFLAQLIAEAGHAMPNGVDLLVTPEMGRDVFPHQPSPSRAAGVYFSRDRYCVVRSTLPAGFREQVIRHELVHAYSRRPAGLLEAPSFIAEGIAEYLRFLKPGDSGLQIPASAMRNEIADLDRVLTEYERAGVQFSGRSLHALVHLSQRDFYSLPFGYALALAMHAYVGGKPVAEALRSRSFKRLAATLAGIEWAAFRKWVRLNSDGADPDAAAFVEDATHGSESTPGNVLATLRKLGALTAEQQRTIWAETMKVMASTEQIDRVIRLLLARDGGPVVLATDLSRAMDRALDAIDVPEVLEDASAKTFLTATPRAVVASVHDRLRDRHGPRCSLVGITSHPLPLEHPQDVEGYTPDVLPMWLERHGTPRTRYVLCMAQEADGRSKKRVEKIVRHLPANAAILIIDFSTNRKSDARYLAEFLAARGPGLSVAYWRP